MKFSMYNGLEDSLSGLIIFFCKYLNLKKSNELQIGQSKETKWTNSKNITKERNEKSSDEIWGQRLSWHK